MKKRLCVFCGAHSGNNPSIQETTKEVARFLAANHIELVYGGGRQGLMGVLADTMLDCGGVVIGVEVEFLLAKEGHSGLTKLYTVTNMHERKALMFRLSDAFLLLPGGAGSLDEFFEVFTWSQLKLHKKPCAILNVDHYYDALIQFIDHAVDNGFLDKSDRKKFQILGSISSVSGLL